MTLYSGEGMRPIAYPGILETGTADRIRAVTFSMRNVERNRANVALYEFEDVIAAVDGVRMLSPRAIPRSEAAELSLRVVDYGRRLLGMRKQAPIPEQRLEGTYDLFFAAFHFPSQLRLLDRLPGWRDRCRFAACFLVEAWTKELPRWRHYLRLLDQFDQVFVFNAACLPTLAHYTSAPLRFMPMATDALRFSPWPSPPPRSIDVYSYGRRSPATHHALLDLAEREGWFYVYDTLGIGTVSDYRAHRTLLARMLQRSRYTIAYDVNANRIVRTGGEQGLAARYFEGAASGAIMLGSAPPIPEWEECFGYPDALVEIPYEALDIGAMIAELENDPERLAQARRAAVINSLRRHDWVHRWATILEAASLPRTERMRSRMAELERVAQVVEADAARTGEPWRRQPRSTPPAAQAALQGESRTIRRVTPTRLATTASLEPSLHRRGGEKTCSNCGELVRGSLESCPYCGEEI